MTPRELIEAFSTWDRLNEVVRQASEQDCLRLLEHEKRRAPHLGGPRLTYLLRVHSRLNKVRADRERANLKYLTR